MMTHLVLVLDMFGCFQNASKLGRTMRVGSIHWHCISCWAPSRTQILPATMSIASRSMSRCTHCPFGSRSLESRRGSGVLIQDVFVTASSGDRPVHANQMRGPAFPPWRFTTNSVAVHRCPLDPVAHAITPTTKTVAR
jgi:hypothetical protein